MQNNFHAHSIHRHLNLHGTHLYTFSTSIFPHTHEPRRRMNHSSHSPSGCHTRNTKPYNSTSVHEQPLPGTQYTLIHGHVYTITHQNTDTVTHIQNTKTHTRIYRFVQVNEKKNSYKPKSDMRPNCSLC